MTNSEAVRQLGQFLGLELELGSDEAAELIVGEDLSILISGDPDGSRLRFTGVVATFPEGDAASAARTLLKANYDGQGTGAAALALDPVSEDVVLTRAFDVANQAADGLSAAVEEFANYLEFWQSRLDSLVAGPAADPATPTATAALRV